MSIPMNWRERGAVTGWIVFAILSLPVLALAIRVGLSEGFTFSKVSIAIIFLIIIGINSRLVTQGLSKGSIVLLAVSLLIVALILVAYAAAISMIIGGLNINIF